MEMILSFKKRQGKLASTDACKIL